MDEHAIEILGVALFRKITIQRQQRAFAFRAILGDEPKQVDGFWCPFPTLDDIRQHEQRSGLGAGGLNRNVPLSFRIKLTTGLAERASHQRLADEVEAAPVAGLEKFYHPIPITIDGV